MHIKFYIAYAFKKYLYSNIELNVSNASKYDCLQAIARCELHTELDIESVIRYIPMTDKVECPEG